MEITKTLVILSNSYEIWIYHNLVKQYETVLQIKMKAIPITEWKKQILISF